MTATLPTSDVQDRADEIVAHEVAVHLHRRAMARAILRSAANAIAQLEGDQAAADVCFSRFSKHNSRASREAMRTGSRR